MSLYRDFTAYTMPRGRSVTIATGPGHRAKVSSIKKLEVKVRRNTKQLAAKEVGRIRIVMDSTPDTTAVVQNISFVAQGVGVGNRHGRKLHAKSVSVRGTILKNTAAPNHKIRFMIFRDNLGTTTAPGLTDLFTDENDFFENQHRLINEQPQKRFTILWDKFIIMNENFDGATPAASFKFSKKLNFDIIYTGAAATDEGKNSLWFMSSGNEATNVPNVIGDIVFKYTDL